MVKIREEILNSAIVNFSKYGSKRFSMDELAQSLAVSKKTLYKYFANKDELVTESVKLFLNRISDDIFQSQEGNEPVKDVIIIYEKCLILFSKINPSYLIGLSKNYPQAFEIYMNFKQEIVLKTVKMHLSKAQEMGQLRNDVNLELFCLLILLRFDDILFAKPSLFDKYSIQELLENLIKINLRGIMTLEHQKLCF